MIGSKLYQHKSLRRKLTSQYLGIFSIVYFILLVVIMLTIITSEYVSVERHTVNIILSKLKKEESIIIENVPKDSFEKYILSYIIYDKTTNVVIPVEGIGEMPDYGFLRSISIFDKIRYFSKTGDAIYSISVPNQVYNRIAYVKFAVFDYTLESIFIVEILFLIITFVLVYFLGVILFASIGNAKTKKALKPIHDLTVLTSSINENNMNLRIDVDSARYELKELCITLNSMLQRIETVYKKQKTFVSDVSHELRTPISVIDGYANMLKRWGSSDETVLSESIDAIISEAKNMKDLVEALLFLARYDHQSVAYEKDEVDISGLLEDVFRETILLDNKQHILHSLIDLNLLCTGDYGKLKECIRIFIDNSLKYTDKDKDIYIEGKDIGKFIVISIKDSGIGISKEHLGNIFNRFYRAEVSRDKKSGGSGLGLPIARVIILAHKGKIRFFSKEGKGTTVEIYLPKIKKLGII